MLQSASMNDKQHAMALIKHVTLWEGLMLHILNPAWQMLAMRHLLFDDAGCSSQLPWPAWKRGFFFCEKPELQFGLMQRQGGPCGLLAAVQVLTMQHIIRYPLCNISLRGCKMATCDISWVILSLCE